MTPKSRGFILENTSLWTELLVEVFALMAFLEHKLNLKVQQKQVLTPSLVQMVNLLALNKLELTDMIQQELVQNPVLEEGTEIVEGPELNAEAPDLTLSRNGTEPGSDSIEQPTTANTPTSRSATARRRWPRTSMPRPRSRNRTAILTAISIFRASITT